MKIGRIAYRSDGESEGISIYSVVLRLFGEAGRPIRDEGLRTMKAVEHRRRNAATLTFEP